MMVLLSRQMNVIDVVIDFQTEIWILHLDIMIPWEERDDQFSCPFLKSLEVG